MKKTLFFLLSSIFGLLAFSATTFAMTCTDEAKICPDGSEVYRTGTNCSFAACPSAAEQSYIVILHSSPLASNGYEAESGGKSITTPKRRGLRRAPRRGCASMTLVPA